MKRQVARLTRDQKHQLLRMGERGGFTLKKAARVLGIHNTTLKTMIGRESDEFFEAMCKAFPGAFKEEERGSERWGPRTISQKDIGNLKVPRSLHTLAATRAWNRGMLDQLQGAGRGA